MSQQSLSAGRAGSSLIAALLGLSSQASVAALTAQADGLSAVPQRWRSDPVTLIPDRDQLIVMPGQLAQLSLAEAEQLVNAVNLHFSDDFTLQLGAAHRWYLIPNQPLDIVTVPIDGVVGGSARAYQVKGNDGLKLERWLNELQMVLFSEPINQAREAGDQYPINSLWVWDMNLDSEQVNLPSLPPVTTVLADDGWAATVAAHRNIESQPIPLLDQVAESLARMAASAGKASHDEAHILIDLARLGGEQLPDPEAIYHWCQHLQPLLGNGIKTINLFSVSADGWALQSWRRSDFSWWKQGLARFQQLLAGKR